FAIKTAAGSLGQANLLSGAFSIDLHTTFAYTTQIQNTCADGFTTTTVLDGLATPPTFPLRMEGVMRISPALTADGHFRLARMALSGPQYSSFVRLRTCTGTPPPATCNAGDP